MSEVATNPTPAGPNPEDVEALQRAFEQFMQTTSTLESAYHQLQGRVDSLDRELEEKNRELAYTTDHLNSVLNSMSDGVIAIDDRGTVTTFNRAAEEVLGFRAGDVLGQAFEEVFGRPFGDSKKMSASEWTTVGGETIPVSERTAPVSGKDGVRIGSVKVFQDLSEIESLREQVRRNDRLAAIGEMAATVAHEIRNPLGGVRGFAALLERDLAQDDDRRRLVEKILTGTRNLDRVVNELLEYTRPIELNKRACNLRDIFDAATGLADIDRDRVQLENAIDADAVVFADEDRVRQVFLNILLNAAQSIIDSGSIRAESEHRDGEYRVAITDSGPGIAPDHLKKVFSPFFTTKEKGTGLGLAVAAKTIESHGGALQVSSEEGAGATFTVCLPAGDPAAS